MDKEYCIVVKVERNKDGWDQIEVCENVPDSDAFKMAHSGGGPINYVVSKGAIKRVKLKGRTTKIDFRTQSEQVQRFIVAGLWEIPRFIQRRGRVKTHAIDPEKTIKDYMGETIDKFLAPLKLGDSDGAPE